MPCLRRSFIAQRVRHSCFASAVKMLVKEGAEAAARVLIGSFEMADAGPNRRLYHKVFAIVHKEVFKSVALKTGSEQWDRAARFWGRIFAINFVFGVVTGIPMEFEFGTNWARFSRLSGGVIGQPLAMEGVFSFFLESAFLGLFSGSLFAALLLY